MKQHSSELPQLTTTEELIVQYLDGELVRKELETMLFERLAQSNEARTLLREHLMMRGAIRSSMNDEMFQLSSELDDRTRGRIEQMLQTISLETPAGVIPVREFAPDAPAVATNAATRSLKRWGVRPSYALLLLLLSVGTTWYLTRTVTKHQDMAANTVHTQTSQSPANSQPQSNTVAPAGNSGQELPSAPLSTVNHNNAASDATAKTASNVTPATVKPQVIVREVIKYRDRPQQTSNNTKEYAQNTAAALNNPTPAKPTESNDPADIMISHRYAKMLNAAAKHEVVVTSHDRL